MQICNRFGYMCQALGYIKLTAARSGRLSAPVHVQRVGIRYTLPP